MEQGKILALQNYKYEQISPGLHTIEDVTYNTCPICKNTYVAQWQTNTNFT